VAPPTDPNLLYDTHRRIFEFDVIPPELDGSTECGWTTRIAVLRAIPTSSTSAASMLWPHSGHVMHLPGTSHMSPERHTCPRNDLLRISSGHTVASRARFGSTSGSVFGSGSGSRVSARSMSRWRVRRLPSQPLQTRAGLLVEAGGMPSSSEVG
jgi:hypothetical protein